VLRAPEEARHVRLNCIFDDIIDPFFQEAILYLLACEFMGLVGIFIGRL